MTAMTEDRRASESIRQARVPLRSGLGLATTPPVLTAAQTEVLRLRALGLTEDAISARLSISRYTARNHLNSAYLRLDAACLVDALRAVGWLQVPEA